jgi:hypothetical protein
MPNRSSTDINQIAARIVEESTGISVEGKNPFAVALGRAGGLKGGPARAARLTPGQRRKIAVKAAKVRWRDRRRLDDWRTFE